METLAEFKKRIRNITCHHKHKIRNSLGIYDGYKWYRKNKPDNKKYILTESQYFAITRQVNNLIANEISRGNEVKLPYRMGFIEIRKYNKNIRISEDGKIITNLPIDWNKTLELWYTDKEAYDNKTLIRIEENEIYKIVWNKNICNFNNRCFYEFVPNKELRSKLKFNIKKGIVDALYIGRIKNVV